MCLEDILTKKELKEFKKGLPDVFPVWKAMLRDGRCEFNPGTDVKIGGVNKNEQELKKKGVYFARNCPKRRMSIRGMYKPGFHAFLSREDAERYESWWAKTIQAFQAKKTWIRAVGTTEKEGIRAVVLSRIERVE